MALLKALQSWVYSLFRQPAEFFYQREQWQYERRLEAVRISAQNNPHYWEQQQRRRN